MRDKKIHGNQTIRRESQEDPRKTNTPMKQRDSRKTFNFKRDRIFIMSILLILDSTKSGLHNQESIVQFFIF